MSVSAAQQEGPGGRKKPFKCFFCRLSIGFLAAYFRMLDPRGGVNSWNGAKNVVYLHGDGAKCVGRPRPETATDACAGGCGKSGPG